jgi:hypothetical protein
LDGADGQNRPGVYGSNGSDTICYAQYTSERFPRGTLQAPAMTEKRRLTISTITKEELEDIQSFYKRKRPPDVPCLLCQRPFKRYREDQKFCSNSHRTMFHRIRAINKKAKDGKAQ